MRSRITVIVITKRNDDDILFCKTKYENIFWVCTTIVWKSKYWIESVCALSLDYVLHRGCKIFTTLSFITVKLIFKLVDIKKEKTSLSYD